MATVALRVTEIDATPLVAETCGRVNPAHVQGRPAYAFDVLHTRADFDRLEADWNALFSRSGRPTQVFQTFDWCWHWCRAFLGEAGGRSELAVVTGRDHDGRLVLVIPLVKERAAGLSRLVWLGEPVSQYGDALIDDVPDPDALVEGAWRHLTSIVEVDLVRLRKVRADAVIAPLLARLGARITEHCEAPYLDLTTAPSFSTYEQRYTAKARKNRRRLMRRLEEQGPVEVAQLRQGPDAGTHAVLALSLKKAWLASRKCISPALADPRTARFFQALAGDGERAAGTIVSLLRCNGTLAGAQIGFACKGRLLLHVIVYDLAFEKSGVGVLHLERTIADAYAAGLHTVDLLAPNDAYKMDWADGTVGVDDFALPLTLKGGAFAHLYLGHLRRRLKSLAAYAPGLARSAMAVTTVL